MKKVCLKFLTTGIVLTIIGVIAMVVLAIFGLYRQPNIDISKYFSDGSFVTAESTELTSEEAHFGDDVEIDSLDISVDFGSVTVQQGDEFYVYSNNIDPQRYTLEVKDGCLTLKYNNSENLMNLFSGKYPEILITLPKIAYEKVDFCVNAGELYAYDITAKDIDITINAGSASFDRIIAQDSADIKMNAGAADFYNSSFNDCDLKMQAGAMDFSNFNLTGENNIKLQAGALNMDIIGSLSDYNINVKKTAGDVSINGRSYENNVDVTVTTMIAETSFETNVTEVPQESDSKGNSIDIKLTAGECNIDFSED